MKSSFLSKAEMQSIGFRTIGENVFISKHASFYSPELITIGHNVRIDDFCILSGRIEIGSYVHISAYVALYGKNGIVISDFAGISAKSIVYSAVDDFSGEFLVGPMCPQRYTHVTGGTVFIKRYAQIGASSVVMPNLEIGEGAAVGAMSFINRNLDSWGIYAGIPVRKIKERSKNILSYNV
ncbi:acyltransferase [Parabacteroides johnsonii]|uniref:acyltransferase n=1 Tax=Parabacteroides johnsonii TaxID=387661 RepID=UPI00265C93AA|nr:acyltransferase [Parabacteroides johnsonii]